MLKMLNPQSKAQPRREYRLIIRPQRVLWLGLVGILLLTRNTGAITVKGMCPECGAIFELPPRRKALFKVKCPNGHEVLRIKALIRYIKHKRGEKE